MRIKDPRFPVDSRSTTLALLLLLGFWAWFFGHPPSSPSRYRVPTTPHFVPGGRDG